MKRSSVTAIYILSSLALVAGPAAGLLAAFPGFFSGPRGEGVAIGCAVGWSVMLATFFMLLLTIDKSQNAFLGGYVAGFLARLAALGITALIAASGKRHPLEFVLVSLASCYFALFIIEAFMLGRMDFVKAPACPRRNAGG